MNAKIDTSTEAAIKVRITAQNEQGSPAGKLCDAEVVFGPACGPLAGLRLIGFAVWERRTPNSRRNVTFPARTYTVNGERRSFALLRPDLDLGDTDAIRDAILAAFADVEGAR